ncbi:serine/threonine-protein kinase [Microbacterium gorillae]|uniref:serine/threonine-protein kinase n=1 Tax=Microbacterium gorillae TaxID=1231063 RepID=UPI00058EAE18|nr:serine/threonine-protein kinase [Microbacterium gorillae]
MAKRVLSAPPVLAGLTFVRPLGSGGFADVFLYEQAMPRRSVAVKVLPSDVRDSDLLRMFNAEADVLARLSAHPSIVTVYQAGISADGRAYIVMEYCPGSMSPRYRTERIPVPEVLAVGVKMAGALETAHRTGLVHRDIKPGNILITAFGQPVLADFGIASSLARATPDGMMAMSVPWTAPEVIAEHTSGDVTSEVWSLGATVYSLLAGQSPFERPEQGQNSREQLRRRILRATYTPVHRSDVPDALQEVLAAAMRRTPRERYASALALAEALRAVETSLGLAPTPLEVAEDVWAAPAISFDDASTRGHVRAHVSQTSARKTAAGTALSTYARPEDDGIPVARRSGVPWGWLIGGGVALIAVGTGLGVWLAGVL